MTATAEFFGLRPVANAFGTSVSITATFGFGRSAIAHSRSTMSWSSGAWSRSTTFAPEASSASLSEVKYWKSAKPDDDQEHRDEPDVEEVDQDDREDDVEQPEQAACEQHPEGQAGVASVCLAFH